MYKNKFFIVLLLIAGCLQIGIAKEKKIVPGGEAPPQENPEVTLRSDCVASTSQIDLNINNVRARLLGGGDLWWDLSDGRYVIPNVEPGEREVSSIFAAAIWIGGYDAAGNLKLAAQTYRQNGNDFWPGPINEEGTTDQATCQQWDRHFEVFGSDIEDLVADYLQDDDGDGLPDNSVDGEVPESLLRWPARNNDYFQGLAGFDLPPNTDLAPFYDQDGDGDYDPYKGDIPQIGVIGCEATSAADVSYADQMIWWMYNDVGNIHSESGADQIGMEIQALAFSYATNNAVNNMSFYKYTLLNKANVALLNTYIGQWVDPDLGCWNNDYVGCVVEESLGIVYNGEGTDPDCEGVNGYGTQVPMLGVDYFRGPLAPKLLNADGSIAGDPPPGETPDTLIELGMSAFIYYNNNFDPSDDPATTNPEEAQDFYGYLSGFWKDDSPVEEGGDGFMQGTNPTPYMFPGDPSNSSEWSECSVGNDPDDRRFVQSSGPFILNPGTTNEVIVGAVWVPEGEYPCPSFAPLLNADRVAQGLFDSCFDIVDGPDAPDISVVELDQELILTLSNAPSSNNFNEEYQEFDPLIPPGFQDSVYNFQGYSIYQLLKPTVPCDNFDDCDEARLVATVDISDGVGTIVNYEPFNEVSGIFTPAIKVQADDNGIRHSFSITDDRFATEETRLVNHKKYYFTAVAYAYNNYLPFDPNNFENTQKAPYLQGRRNISTYTGIPHKNQPENGTVINAQYGDAPEITRIDGEGLGGIFLELTDESIAAICESGKEETFTYQTNAGPFEVKVFDPLRLKGGTYTLTLVDDDLTDDELKDPINWVLEGNGVTVNSEKPVGSAYEQLIPELGISISVSQTGEVYDNPFTNNGFFGATVTYDDPSGVPWYTNVQDDAFGFVSNYIKTGSGEADELKDPNRVYSNVLSGAWAPFYLTTATPNPPPPNVPNFPPDYFVTPRPDKSFINGQFTTADNRRRNALPNVDIVLTSDKSKWSRCIVVNSFTEFYADPDIGGILADDDAFFGVRDAQSVGKDGQPDGTGTGMSWFPGYAIDVETGERLNVFFGENTFYGGNILPDPDSTGNDMMWNPSTFFAITENPSSIVELSMGAQHHIYVTTTLYDEGQTQLDGIGNTNTILNAAAWADVGWVSTAPIPAIELNSIEDGIIPNDVTFKLRVNNPFQVTDEPTSNNGYPKYEFTIDADRIATIGDQQVAEDALDLIRAVPNPYYGFSAYENSSIEQVVKFTNLPAKCKISIYSLDGRLIRTYNRDAQPDLSRGTDQLITSEEWDLKNEQGISIASGVYIIHIDANASGLGEKVLKWFGGVREFDTTGL